MDLSEGGSKKNKQTYIYIYIHYWQGDVLMQVMKEHQLWFWGDQREEERCCEWTR